MRRWGTPGCSAAHDERQQTLSAYVVITIGVSDLEFMDLRKELQPRASEVRHSTHKRHSAGKDTASTDLHANAWHLKPLRKASSCGFIDSERMTRGSKCTYSSTLSTVKSTPSPPSLHSSSGFMSTLWPAKSESNVREWRCVQRTQTCMTSYVQICSNGLQALHSMQPR